MLSEVKMNGIIKILRILSFDYDHISLFADIIEGREIDVNMNNVMYISKLF